MSDLKLEINGKTYDIIDGLERASLQTLYVLKCEQGIGMRTLQENAMKLGQIKDPLDLLEDPDAFKVLMTVIWLARRAAGEKITFEEANDDFGIADLKMITPDEPAESDPKALPASDPAEGPQPA